MDRENQSLTSAPTTEKYLVGSKDPQTGHVFFPQRQLCADGSLRATETVQLSGKGTLFSWTRFAGKFYGQIDLPEGVRIQSLLEGDAPTIGAEYQVVFKTDEDENEYWRFARV